jgi:hypothetical protein
MNERERFEMGYRQIVARYVERIQTMTENQVVHELRAMKAGRNSADTTLAFLNSVSLAATEDCQDEINKLRSQISSYPRPSDNPFHLLDFIEDALKKRLETLRKNGR